MTVDVVSQLTPKFLEHRLRATWRLDELTAVADAPFEHASELADKTRQLTDLNAPLRSEQNGPAAAAAAAVAKERLEVAGREPGWSLQLNPTPATLEEVGIRAADYRASRVAVDRSTPA